MKKTYIKYIPAGLPWYSISIPTPIRTENDQTKTGERKREKH